MPTNRGSSSSLSPRHDVGSRYPRVLLRWNARGPPATTMPAGIAWFQVKVWEVAFGTSYEQAVSNPQPQNGTAGT